mgnify:CR=1
MTFTREGSKSRFVLEGMPYCGQTWDSGMVNNIGADGHLNANFPRWCCSENCVTMRSDGCVLMQHCALAYLEN